MVEHTTLVTGGAGYIGSHAVLALRDAGQGVVVIDDLSTGARTAISSDVPFFEGNVADAALVRSVIREFGVDAVMHFAGSVVVPESVENPLKYYKNNTCVSRTLVETCVEEGVANFIFSSTAAVYGTVEINPVTEDLPPCPDSPYGKTKLVTEWMLRDVSAAIPGFRHIALRYFNVAGADPLGRAGQSTPNATHLIKVACEAAAGRRDYVAIFGEDYDTPDGTGVRDFIHVTDLVEAHMLALAHLRGGGESLVLNCGYGKGFSVREVLEAVRRYSGTDFEIRGSSRRPGDIPVLIADAEKIRERLGWAPHHDTLETIVAGAVNWERSLKPSGGE